MARSKIGQEIALASGALSLPYPSKNNETNRSEALTPLGHLCQSRDL